MEMIWKSGMLSAVHENLLGHSLKNGNRKQGKICLPMAENFRGISSAVDVIASNVISWHSIDRQIYDYAPGSNVWYSFHWSLSILYIFVILKNISYFFVFHYQVRNKEFPGNLTYVIERFACYRSSVPCFMFSKKETIGDNDSADKVVSAFTCCQRIDPFAWKIYWTLNDKLEFLVNWLRGFR